ncbi:MAG TPA: LrgB family protein [Longimicrobium sp.]|jgi:predicted murein hydrolase (TIGR00659 family)|uniref:LrgB family protein n=1 Tax=Longimicrobium sp. TaxID=2029185 RepID=UPI002ED7E573
MTEPLRPLALATLAIAATLAVYAAARVVQRRTGSVLLHPVLVAIVTLILALRGMGIGYAEYQRGGRLLGFWLGPAVVALGLPLYRQMEEIGRRRRAVLLSLLAGSAVGVVTATGTALLFGASSQVVRSLASRSVTTPIAMAISARVGGLPPLSAAVVILSGILGAVAGPPLLRVMDIRSRTAWGIAMGASAHGVGTARAAEEGDTEAASSGLAIGIMGVFTAVMAPLVIWALAELEWIGPMVFASG